MPNFALRLKELRQSKELSQQKLADYLKISKSSVNMYERGDREPGLEMLEAIADFFNVDLDYLLGKSDIPNRLFPRQQSSRAGNNYKQIINDWIEEHPKEFDEQMLIVAYRPLDDMDKEIIWDALRKLYKSDKYKDVDFTL